MPIGVAPCPRHDVSEIRRAGWTFCRFNEYYTISQRSASSPGVQCSVRLCTSLPAITALQDAAGSPLPAASSAYPILSTHHTPIDVFRLSVTYCSDSVNYVLTSLFRTKSTPSKQSPLQLRYNTEHDADQQSKSLMSF